MFYSKSINAIYVSLKLVNSLVWKVEGIITALLTPLSKDGDLCAECLKDILEYQLSNGVSGFFIMGTYGEGPILNQKVKRKMLEKTLEYVPSKTVVLPHIATSDIEASYELARYAKNLGYEVVSSVGPIYFKASKKGLMEYFKYISQTDLGVVIYNNSDRLKYNITPSLFEEICREVPTIMGIKDSSSSVEQLLEYVTRFKNRYFIAGAGDNLIYYTFIIGADAHVCALSNVFPRQASELYKAILDKDLAKAREIQSFFNKIRAIVKKFNTESSEVLKEILKLKGINAGYPLAFLGGLEHHEREELRELIKPYLDTI